MALTTTCCNCGTRQPLAAGFADDDGKRFGVAMGALPPQIARAAVAYLAVFKPAKCELRTSRATKLISELGELVAAGTVSRDERTGARRPATVSTWVAGIDQLLAAPPSSLPLTNHNYLRAIVFELADKADARAEREREDSRRTGQHRAGPSPVVPREDRLTAELAHLKTLLDYGKLDQVEHDSRVAHARAKFSGANHVE